MINNSTSSPRLRSATVTGEQRKKSILRRSHSAGTARGGFRRTLVDVKQAKQSTNKLTEPRTSNEEESKKIKVVIIHGDPSKPNPILPGGKWDEDDFECVEILKQALSKLTDTYEFKFMSNHDSLILDLQKLSKTKGVDIVLQFCDDGYQNNPRMEMHLCSYLEMLNIPYTGSSPVALGTTYDKQIVLEIAKSIGIPVPQSILIEKDNEVLETIKSNNIVYPVFVKPNCTDGSYGITRKSICYNDEEVMEALDMIRNRFFIAGPILIQEYLTGVDLNTAFIGNAPNCLYLPVTEEDYGELPSDFPKILGFEAKWDENSPYFRIGTVLAHSISEETKKFLNECSVKLAKRIGLRDYARFDWKLDSKGNPRLLEANPNCGWSYDAHLQRMCALIDISYSEMLRLILEAARERTAQAAKTQAEQKVLDLESVSEVRLPEKQAASNAREPRKL